MAWQGAIPPEFAKRMRGVHGEAGAAWVAGLAGRIDEYAERWSLTLGEPFLLSYNFVLPATRADGSPAVLKLGVPHTELFTEIEALKIYDGRGICRLLDADLPNGVFLLERLFPGTMLSTVYEAGDDDRATKSLPG